MTFELSDWVLISFHNNIPPHFTDQMQMIMFMKNISITRVLFFLIAYGAGKYSLDNRKQGSPIINPKR